jgi:hypothetical protein
MKAENMVKGILILAIIVFTSCTHIEKADKSIETKTSQASEMKMDARVKNALAFINGYVKNADKMKQSADVTDWVNSNNLSTKRFKKELKRVMDEAFKAEPGLGLEADPLLDAQDYPDKGFELETINEKTNYFTVRGIDQPGFKLTMKIINENGKWLVDGCGMINIPEGKRAER